MKTAVIYDKWLHQFGGAEVVATTMADILLRNGWKIIFISGQAMNPTRIKEKLSFDLEDVEFHTVWNNENKLKSIVKNKDLFINLSFMDYSYGYAKKNIYYTHFPTPIRNFLFNITLAFFKATNLHTLFPINIKQRISDRLRAGIFFDMDKRLSSYDVILANSKFTQKWIKNYWKKDSQVFYPPVQFVNPMIRESVNSKHNWICSVGRFFTLGHGKKQEVMIEAFKRLIASVSSDWQLHLIGGVGDEMSSLQFIDRLKTMSKGYPIYFHLNASHAEVENILLKSKIYWHVTGFGENEETNPMAFEHFGIAPIEAICAGCIPILYDGGGLSEIIKILNLDKNKHLFISREQLIQLTLSFIQQGCIFNFSQVIKQVKIQFSATTFSKKFIPFI